MPKNDNRILVVKRDILFENDYFEGFKAHGKIDYVGRILKNFQYIKRDIAENNPEYKQPICYCVILNPALGRVFTYQRSQQEKNYKEVRLSGRWSWGLGGHIEPVDSETENPIQASLVRELKEEVDFNLIGDPKLLGYINYDIDEVGKVHFGILYVLETSSDIILPKDLEINKGRLLSLKEIEDICSSSDFKVEDWSRLSLSPVKSYLERIKTI